jgi:hypothetical protein
MRRTYILFALSLGGAAFPAAGRAGVTQDSFLLRSTGDLADLCAAAPNEALGTEALNFCEGFGLGVYRVLAEVDAARGTHTFCMPTPMPTRNEALEGFVRWARANPDQSAQTPQDGIATFLSSQYPCDAKK